MALLNTGEKVLSEECFSEIEKAFNRCIEDCSKYSEQAPVDYWFDHKRATSYPNGRWRQFLEEQRQILEKYGYDENGNLK